MIKSKYLEIAADYAKNDGDYFTLVTFLGIEDGRELFQFKNTRLKGKYRGLPHIFSVGKKCDVREEEDSHRYIRLIQEQVNYDRDSLQYVWINQDNGDRQTPSNV